MQLHHSFISPVLSVILCCWKRRVCEVKGEVTCQRLVVLTPPTTLYHTLCTQTDHITIKCVARRKLLRLCLHCVL